MRKESVKRGIWHIGGRKTQQRGGAFPLAALDVPILGNLCGVIIKKFIGDDWRKRYSRWPYG